MPLPIQSQHRARRGAKVRSQAPSTDRVSTEMATSTSPRATGPHLREETVRPARPGCCLLVPVPRRPCVGVGEQSRQGVRGSSHSQDHQAEDQTFICKALEEPGLGLGVVPAPPVPIHSLSWGRGVRSVGKWVHDMRLQCARRGHTDRETDPEKGGVLCGSHSQCMLGLGLSE